MLRMLSEKLNAPLTPKPEWFWLCRNRVFLQAVAGFLNLCLLDKITASEFEEEYEQGIEIPIEGEEKVTLLGLPVIQEGEEEEKAEALEEYTVHTPFVAVNEEQVIPAGAAVLVEEPLAGPFSCEPLEHLASTVTPALSDEERIFEGISSQDRIIPPGVQRRPTAVILKIIENFFKVKFGIDMPRTMDEYYDIDDEKSDIFYKQCPVNTAERNEWIQWMKNKKRIIHQNAFERHQQQELEQQLCLLEQEIAQYNAPLLKILDEEQGDIFNPLHTPEHAPSLRTPFDYLTRTRPLEISVVKLLQEHDRVTHPGQKYRKWVNLTKPLTEEEKLIKVKLEDQLAILIQKGRETTELLFEEEKNLHIVSVRMERGVLCRETDTTPAYDEYFQKGIILGEKIELISHKLHYLTRE